MHSLIKFSLMSVVASTLLIVASGCGGGGGGDSTTYTPASTVTGIASVSGSTATAGSGISASSAFKATATVDVDTTTTAVLVVDSNLNGEFGDSEDKVLTSNVHSDGSFDFGTVTVNEKGETKAQLTVSKQGFAPVRKIITLTDGQSISIEVDAASAPLLTEVVDISTLRTAGTLSSSFLKIGIKKTDVGLSSYSQILSLSDMKANAEVPISGDVETETVIPLGALPDSVTSITVETQSFDPTNEEDAAKFPGEYTGVGKSGEGEQRLVSVGFDYMSLTDQNGDTIELDLNQLSASSKLLPQAVDYTSCLRTSIRRLSGAQLELFKKYGDDDNTTKEFEVPLWFYNSSAGNWQYLGQAEVYEDRALTVDYNVSSTSSSAYAKMCITENWGTSVNLDYSFAPQEPLNVCVVAKDQDGEAISGLSITAKKDTARETSYLNKDGKTKIALLAGNTATDYEFSYSGSLTGWNRTTVQNDEITSGGEEGCNDTINITVVNPYSATLKVTVKELDGSLAANKYVYVYNSSWGQDYYYESAYTDENGEATFKVKPNTNYGVYYASAVVDVNINATVTAPEQADDGRLATVTVQEKEQAPVVSVYMYNNSISDTAKSVNFSVSASDGNGDAISLKSLTLNGTALVKGVDYTVTKSYTSKDYDYFTAKLDLNTTTVRAITPSSLNAGAYSLVATYSDGKNDSSDSQRFTVKANRAPQISSVYLHNDTKGWIYINSNIAADTYNINAYAYDPDGDKVSITYTLDGVGLTSNTDVTLDEGAHTLVINASDKYLDTNKTFDFFIGNHAPEITSFGATSYSIDLASENTTIKLYAYAQDKDHDTLSVKTTVGNITLSPSYSGSNYFTSSDITIDGNTTFTIYANDGDKNSTVKSLTVTTYAANQAPVFTKELTSSQIPVGSSLTLECVATDPESPESDVSYSWSIDGVTQSETGTTLTHTFTKSAVVSCTATDADILEPASTTSTAIITTYDASAVGTLIVNTLPGAIVATHDTTTLVPLEEKTAGDDGKATFTVAGSDRVTFSVSLSPNLEVSEKTVFGGTLQEFSYMLDEICTYSETPADTCSDYDRTSFLAGTTISNTLGNLVFEATGQEITAESIDTNKNGSVDSSENYAFVLSTADADGNGKLTWSEFNGASNVNSEFYVNVPVREYNINIDAYQYSEGVNQGYYDENEWKPAYAAIDFSGFIEGVSIQLSNYWNTVISADGNATVANYPVYPNVDGTYSFLAKYRDENNVTKYLLELDKTATEIATLSYTPEDFVLTGTPITFTVSDGESIYIDSTYKNQYLEYASSYNPEGVLLDNSNLTYSIGVDSSSYDSATGISTWKNQWNYYKEASVRTTYNSTDYPNLDVSAAYDGVDTVSFSGADLTKVNGTQINYSNYTVDTSWSVSYNYSLVPSSVTFLDLNTTLPSTIRASISDISPSNVSVNVTEFKGASETDFLNGVADYSYNFYENGQRYVYFSIPLNTSLTATSTLTKEVKPRYTKPFRIGYEAKSAFVR